LNSFRNDAQGCDPIVLITSQQEAAVASYADSELSRIDALDYESDEDEREHTKERKKRPRRASVDYEMLGGPRFKEEYDLSYLVRADAYTSSMKI
jgi:streptogramin lyase